MKDRDIKASVIIPTRNRSQCLPTAVKSVLAQGYENFEVIIVNDGSTDDTKEVARQLSETDSRIRILECTGEGQSAAVNHGLGEARGTIAIMLSDDDVLYPGCLSAMIPVFEEDESVVVVTGEYDLIDWEENILSSMCSPQIDLKTLLLDHHCNFGVGAGFRVDAANRAGGWDPRYRHAPDYDFWMRMALEGEFFYVQEKFGGWRRHPDQISAASVRGSLSCAREHIQIVEEFLERDDLPDEFRDKVLRARSAAHVVAAIVLDPDHLQQDRRFLVVDRASMALDEQGRTSPPEDLVGRLVKTAEERLQLIHSLEADLRRIESAAEDRLQVIESLERDLKKSLSDRDEMSKTLQQSRGGTGGLVKRGLRKLLSIFQAAPRS